MKPLLMHIIHEDGAGGGPVAMRNNCDFLAKNYRQICVYGGRGSIDAYCRSGSVTGVSIPLQRKIFIAAGFLALLFLLIRHRPSAVLLYGQWAGPVGALAARAAGIRRIIYITHFPSFYTDRSLLRVLRNRIVEQIPCRLSAAVVTPSEGNYAQYVLRHLAPEKKLAVIHSVVHPGSRIPEPDRLALRQKHNWSTDCCHVVSVGRLTEQKRVDWLLRAWQLIEPARPMARLWIIGDGPDGEKLRDLARSLGLRSVIFLGAQPDGPRFIGAADVVVMTSQYEGHAHVPLEALVNGIPLIASNVDGVRESITDGVEGFLVAAGDFTGLAARLGELIDSPPRRAEMGRRGELRARDFYPEQVMPLYAQLIERILVRD